MDIQTLLFTISSPGSPPEQRTISAGSPQKFAAAVPEYLPAVYVVRNRDIVHLRGFSDVIVDRGKKSRNKGLADRLHGHWANKVLLVEGSYASPVQVGRSIRAFLGKSFHEGQRNLSIVGVDETIFDELWKKSAPEGIAGMRASGKPGDGKTFSRGPGRIRHRSLVELLDSCADTSSLAGKFIGKSKTAETIRRLILTAAGADAPVLILGPSGTGKEVVAREIHNNSPKRKSFVAVNCAAIPSELFESELFGYKKGAFTGAKYDKKGLWEMANGGTLFLDEIGDLIALHQAKVLRALEDECLRPVGGNVPVPVNARIIAATNRDLFAMVKTEKFRDDLFYRLRGLPIYTPPLKDHVEDIPLLAEFFWNKITDETDRPLPREILDELQEQPWPGNARQLRMVLNTLHALFPKKVLTLEHLRATMCDEGYYSRQTLESEKEKELLHRTECLRHLKRVDEVVHAIKRNVGEIVEEAKQDQTISPRLGIVHLHLDELGRLCDSPLSFPSELAFDSVHRLKGKFSYFSSLAEEEPGKTGDYWKQDLFPECELVLSTISHEMNGLFEKT